MPTETHIVFKSAHNLDTGLRDVIIKLSPVAMEIKNSFVLDENKGRIEDKWTKLDEGLVPLTYTVQRLKIMKVALGAIDSYAFGYLDSTIIKSYLKEVLSRNKTTTEFSFAFESLETAKNFIQVFKRFYEHLAALWGDMKVMLESTIVEEVSDTEAAKREKKYAALVNFPPIEEVETKGLLQLETQPPEKVIEVSTLGSTEEVEDNDYDSIF